MTARTVKPGTPGEPTPVRVTRVEVCPCGSTYVSGATRDRAVWTAWATRHEGHGFQWGRP